MKFLLCFLCFFVTIHAVSINDIEIISDNEKIEILFFLDSKFDTKVIKQNSNEFSTIILKNINYTKNKVVTKTKLINQIEIFQQNKDVYIIFAIKNFDINYSLEILNSNNILKILITPIVSITEGLLSKSNSLENSISFIKNQTNIQNLPTMNTSSVKLESWRYGLVIFVLFSLLVALIIVKRRMGLKNQGLPFSYFNKQKPKSDSGISISKVINLDMKNKIIVLNGNGLQYLLFVGQNNSFIIDRIENKGGNDDLSKLLEHKELKLPYFLKDYQDDTKEHP